MDDTRQPMAGHAPLRPGAVGPWLREGARTAVGALPRWQSLQVHPAVPVVLVLMHGLLTVLLQRLYLPGPVRFYAGALFTGGLVTMCMAWVSYLVRPAPFPAAFHADPSAAVRFGENASMLDIAGSPASHLANVGHSDGQALVHADAGPAHEGATVSAETALPPSAVALFCLIAAQALCISAACGLVYVALIHAEAARWLPGGAWLALAGACWAWLVLAQWLLLRHCAPQRRRAVALGVLVLAASALMVQWGQPVRYWYPDAASSDESDPPPVLRLDQATMEAQPVLLADRLDALRPQRPGVIDVYSITFAPYAEEDVFQRESELVDSVMQQRFDTAGRHLQLVNHVDTVEEWPWATPLNLQRAIQRVAKLMNRDEDVLFIHLTSHGARNGQLAASFTPMTVDEVTPADLKAWLDEAGIRWRVISISACFSGSWIAPLSGDGTLVMTAADADHTSYGCGRLSELTFFGRAMYDEQLRSHTRSFEQAHAAVRPVIAQREQEAGKADGYSNPQIAVGAAVRQQLRQLEAQLESRPISTEPEDGP